MVDRLRQQDCRTGYLVRRVWPGVMGHACIYLHDEHGDVCDKNAMVPHVVAAAAAAAATTYRVHTE